MEYVAVTGNVKLLSQQLSYELLSLSCFIVGQDSVVGLATRYVLDGPGIKSRWGQNFHICPDRPWGQPSILYNGFGVFCGGKAAGA
jgi:hypothetical protein